MHRSKAELVLKVALVKLSVCLNELVLTARRMSTLYQYTFLKLAFWSFQSCLFCQFVFSHVKITRCHICVVCGVWVSTLQEGLIDSTSLLILASMKVAVRNPFLSFDRIVIGLLDLKQSNSSNKVTLCH